MALGEVEDELVDESRPGPERLSGNRELGRRLRAAMSLLSPRQAEIFALRYLEGFGNLEIARMLGSSQTAIAVILHRARHRLQRELGKAGEPGSSESSQSSGLSQSSGSSQSSQSSREPQGDRS